MGLSVKIVVWDRAGGGQASSMESAFNLSLGKAREDWALTREGWR